MKFSPFSCSAIGALSLFMAGVSSVNAAPNVRLYGTLISEACVIKPGDETVNVDFETIPDKTFYAGAGRTTSTQFEIRLSDCDITINNSVKVTFSGNENQAMAGQGFLAISPASQAAGIAIGLENADGSQLRINQSSNTISLNSGDNALKFSAYVQGEPTAIANRSITRGNFTATATFLLNYE